MAETDDGYDPNRCLELANKIEAVMCGERPVNVLTAIAMVVAGSAKGRPSDQLVGAFKALQATAIRYHEYCRLEAANDG